MPNHSAIAIANEFLKLRNDDFIPQQMLIQKLTYIAHGWNLAINGEPLVAEAPEAWDNGPVYKSIWNRIRDFGYRGPKCTLTDPITGTPQTEALFPTELNVIKHVWAKYGHMAATSLSKMTHEPDTPWSKAYFERGRNASLDNDEIRRHYVALAMAGRAA